jgi:hypothetical protein
MTSSTRPVFVEPKTWTEAHQRLLEITNNAVDIQHQLTSGSRNHEDGTPYTALEYQQWRRRAVYAMNMKQQEGRKLKAWIKDYHIRYGEEARRAPDQRLPGNVVELVAALFKMAQTVEYDARSDDEEDLLKFTRRWLFKDGARILHALDQKKTQQSEKE